MGSVISYSDSFLSLLPPFLAIFMAILTRKVVSSLLLSIVIGLLMLADLDVAKSAHMFIDVFFLSISNEHVFLLLFLLALGVMTSVINFSGGTFAFSNWAASRIKTKRSTSFLTVFLGITIFIDDYFNSLVVGNITKPIADRNSLSRAKLAYFLDSTAAPICVLTPISSWGAYVISILGGILSTKGIDGNGLSLFLSIIPINFYALFAISMIFIVLFFDFNIGSMRKHEALARERQISNIDLPFDSKGRTALSLIVPVSVLVILAFTLIFFTGWLNSSSKSIISIMSSADVNLSLFVSSLIALLVAIFFAKDHIKSNSDIISEFVAGIKLMLPAVYILIAAWLFTEVIDKLQTGVFLSNLIKSFTSGFTMPAILFVASVVISFATGTSFATFSIMLPIAADMVSTPDVDVLAIYMSAVLAGSVCGDHCSPISDTTILSSTGAECPHIVHVETQMPYVILCMFSSIISYVVLGLTSSTLISLLAGSSFLLSVSWMLFLYYRKK